MPLAPPLRTGLESCPSSGSSRAKTHTARGGSPFLQTRALQNFVYDALARIDADKLAADLLKARKEKIPAYAFDCHTLKGRRKGKTKAEFFREEQKALKPFHWAFSTIFPRVEQ
ncbi:MAG: hypothetical protein P4L99_21465 [Chthoniobacter sp.]|nr:hypothetical protein [Chthoniobacter sp.]